MQSHACQLISFNRSLITCMCVLICIAFCRSLFLVPYVQTVVWYFALDSVAMFWSFRKMRGLEWGLGWRRQMGRFLWKKWSFLLHHALIFTVAYPMIVVSCDIFLVSSDVAVKLHVYLYQLWVDLTVSTTLFMPHNRSILFDPRVEFTDYNWLHIWRIFYCTPVSVLSAKLPTTEPKTNEIAKLCAHVYTFVIHFGSSFEVVL